MAEKMAYHTQKKVLPAESLLLPFRQDFSFSFSLMKSSSLPLMKEKAPAGARKFGQVRRPT
ncbi:hypothetical protein C7123_05695 [Tannerella serpentiformis]|nr:hypothetical protein BCB71_10690 [Tannerella serpentiformis]AVV53258.1 hypothetical protein C7123_05695 [Tannerella serpentiformis]